jgi:hypothetical protein
MSRYAPSAYLPTTNMAAYIPKPLADGITQKDELRIRENDIEMHWELAAANLQIIRDKELWRQGDYESWQDYCQRRWRMSRQRAYQLIEGAQTAQEVKRDINDEIVADLLGNKQSVSTIVDNLGPRNEGQARALKSIPREKRARVLKEVAATGKVTAKAIKEAGKPKTSLGIWKELEDGYGRLLNRVDELNRQCPNASMHRDLINQTKSCMGVLAEWKGMVK